jgi:DNA-binding MarR family transcriptional regulator
MDSAVAFPQWTDKLRRMELRQLRYFVAVAEAGNTSRAAQKLFLTQPALSRQIKSLEDEIGQCVLERSAHSIRLTPAGEALLREACDLSTKEMLAGLENETLDVALTVRQKRGGRGLDRTSHIKEKPLAVFIEELRFAAQAVA